jgi:hypothetical protein
MFGLLAATAIALGIGSLIVAGYVIKTRRPPTPSEPEPFQSPQNNYRFLVPGPPWRQASVLRDAAFTIAINFQRTDPAARFVLGVRDENRGYPSDHELRGDALRFLERTLGVTQLETETRDDADLAERRARRFVFQGVLEGRPIGGDVHILTHQGFAFWLFRWCPADQVAEAQPELDDLRDRLGWLDQRPAWQPSRQRFAGTALKFTLTGEGERWQKTPFPPAQYDPLADLVLEARERGSAAEDLSRRAVLTVLVFPTDHGDPAERAINYLLKRLKDDFPDTKLTDISGGNDAGSKPLAIRKLRADRGSGQDRFYWLAIAPNYGRAVVLQFECGAERREIWEPEFRKLSATLTMPAGSQP